MRIKGEKGVPIWKQLAGAIFSWQTAMVVGITVMTMYGREIGAWLQEVFKGKKAIDELRLAQESLNKIKAEGRGEAQSELTRLSLLWGALKDVNTSIETRNKIYDELNEKYPHYFKNLSDETFNLGSVEKGYWQLRDAIMATAQSRVYAESIAKNKEKLELDLKPKLEEAAKIRDDYFKENERTIKRANDAVKQIGTETFVDFYALGVSKKYKALISAEKEAGREILKVEAENFKLFNMVDVGALTNDFGTGKKNDGKAAKVAKEESAELIDIKNISNKQELEDQKEFNEETKRLQKAAYDERKAFTEQTISDSLAEADNQKLRLQEVAIDEIKLAKGNKEKILDIQHELTMNMIAEDEDAQQNILDTAGLEVEAYEDASVRIRRLRLQRGEEEISDTERTESEKKAIRQETMQATAELLSQGLSFAQQIYSAQATRAQEAYDTEMNAAGDSLEYQTLAKRKFEAEDKKIKQRQAIASKLQAVLDAGLALALAIATTWKDPFLAALNIGAATLGLGMALATPIPQFAEGTDFAPSSFIAGEEGSELIRTKSGKMILTPNKATLFSDNSLIGSSIVPHDQTQRMLANMAFNQVHDVIDMRDTNRHLSGIEKNTRNKETRYTDSKGRTVVKRGNLISTL